MAKQSGLGYNFYIDGFDISGDVGAFSKIGAPTVMLDVTGIDKSAHERINGHAGGEIDFNAFWNTAVGREHLALKNNDVSPGVDIIAMLHTGLTVGSAVACVLGKQPTYDWNRGKDGSLLGTVQVVSNGFPLEWAEALTAGKQTDAAPANGASIDGQNYGLVGVSSAFGLSAYLQVFSLAGTSMTVKLQDSADNAAFADIAGASFAAVASPGPGTQRIEIGLTATVRRYIRAVSTGTFTNGVYACAVCRYLNPRDP